MFDTDVLVSAERQLEADYIEIVPWQPKKRKQQDVLKILTLL